MGYFKGAKVSNKEFESKETIQEVEKYPFLANEERGITKETCERYGVRCAVSPTDGKTPIAYYFPSYNKKGKIVGYMKQDLSKNKEERGHWQAVGSVAISNMLFGQNVADSIERKKKALIITEGQWDCLSVFQACKDKVANHPKYSGLEPFVVSIPLGTANASESVLQNLEWVKQFEEFITFFDNDSCTPREKKKGIMKGVEATEAVLSSLVGNGVKLFTLTAPEGYKDASDMLQDGKWEALANLVSFGKTQYTPEKIIRVGDVSFEDIIAPPPEGIIVPQFPKLMEKTSGFHKRTLTLITAPSGAGKCHGEGQEILMHDFTKKKVEDIRVGDKVMGSDGTARTVTGVHSGMDMIYKITPTRGLPYTVNSGHLLVLESNKDFPSRGIEKNKRFTMAAKDFHKLAKSCKTSNIFGVRSSMEKYGNDYTFEDAYILGLWLAEGSSEKPQFTLSKKDKVLHDKLKEYAESRGYGVNVCPSNDRKGCTSYDLNGGFVSRLREWGVLGNKHIPKWLLCSSRQSRMELLAGFLDGDGYLQNGCYEITMKRGGLDEDIVRLAQSLGFYVNRREKEVTLNGVVRTYSRITISGDTNGIPVLVESKKATRTPNKNMYRVGLRSEEIGVGKYYGFEVDGDHQYCLPDLQITHNTTGVSIISNAIEQAGERLGMIYLEEQTKETVQRLVAEKLKVNYLKFKREPLRYASREKLEEIYKEIVEKNDIVLLDHFGSLPIEELMNKVKYLHLVEGCDYIILDHLSMVISGNHSTDERKEIDIVMTELAAFCAAHDVGIIVVCHLNRQGTADQFKQKRGKDDEEDKPYWIRVTKESLRGSGALEQLSYVILGLEPEILPTRERGRVRWCILKNRPTGYLGDADIWKLNEQTWDVELSEEDEF